MAYHLKDIPRGEFGKLSKIREELDEAQDAEDQGCQIMLALELADLYGALEAYVENMSLTMDDLRVMSEITKRAFKTGYRK